MAIQFNTGVINVKGSPAIITDTFPNRPQATSLQMGTIYFSTDTFNIYQVVPFGSTQAWATMGGGGGGSQNWDNVLYQGGMFTNHRYANFNNYDLDFQNVSDFNIKFANNSFWDFNQSYFKYFNSSGVNNILQLNTSNGAILFGDYAGSFGSTHFNVDTPNNRIYFSPSGFPSLLIEAGKTTLGDWYPLSNGTTFICNSNSSQIYSYGNDVINGIYLNYDYLGSGDFNFKFGDFEGISSGYIEIDIANVSSRFGSDYIGFLISPSENVNFGYFNNQGGYLTFFVQDIDTNMEARTQMRDSFGFYIQDRIDEDRGVKIGDYNSVNNGAFIWVNDYYSVFRWNQIHAWEITGNITTTSAGGNSGEHLQITINGTPYVIELKNA